MDERRQEASRINLQLKRLERELEEEKDAVKKQDLQKQIDALRLSIS
jgi:hypothetical protein